MLLLVALLSAPAVGVVTVRRAVPAELTGMYARDWHDDARLRSALLSAVSELVAVGLLDARRPNEARALQKRVYADYLQRFVLAPSAERALLVAERGGARAELVGACCVSVVDATRGGRLRSEPLVQTSGDPSLRPAWPLPWDRTDPLALARALLLGGRDGERESGGVGGVGEAFAPRCVLDSLVVAPDARRGGVGRALLAEAEALARGWGQPSLLLRVEASNSGARAFYAALGYATPAGCASEARGRRLVADSWGSKWAQALDAPLERSF